MKKLCVIGDPVLHSKSPLIQNTMIRALGLDYEYVCQPVKKDELTDWMARALREGWAGFNATMPHKQALVPLMDHLDTDAALFQAVNTVCCRDGEFYGFNTDGGGFIRVLEQAGVPVEGSRFAVLGAGGAAKAVVLELAEQGAGQVLVCNRTTEKAEALSAVFPDRITARGFSPAELADACEIADVLVNCTNLGMAGSPSFESLDFLRSLPGSAPVFDLIYHPERTDLLAEAEDLGHPVTNGIPLLINQAILSLEHFSGVSIDPAAMIPLVKKALDTDNQ